jgi:VIT1/CCC1 family predicted Fe2+/Mn2+ transporter
MDLREYHAHQEAKTHQFGRFQEYLGEFVYGGIDGCVTTFAVVAGAAGAELSVQIVLILGFANLLADGLSMSIGAYLSRKSEQQNYEKHRRIEYQEIEEIPHIEREEIRQIFKEKGFEGKLLEQVVEVITADKDRWVDVMMKEELEMVPDNKSPLAMGAVTFGAFIIVGLIPLLAYLFPFISDASAQQLFIASSILTAIGFIIIGWMKAYVTQSSRLRGILETLLLGGTAAVVAFYVGDWLEKLVG